MYTTLRAFDVGLNEEHLDEISFLYEQRRAGLSTLGRDWRDLSPLEERLEAHLDALVVGGDLALDVCSRAVADGDPGQLFASVSTFCRQNRTELLAETLRILDYQDLRKVEAVGDALKLESPLEWSVFIGDALVRRDARIAPMLAGVAGYRRLRATAQSLADTLMQQPLHVVTFIDALGKLHATRAQDSLLQYIDHQNLQVRRSALIALLRCDFPASELRSLGVQATETWACVELALCGDRSVRGDLLQGLQAAESPDIFLLALGLLGDLSTIGVLVEALDAEEGVAAAAQALEWITGARLHEQHFVPEDVDEALLFDHELPAWRQYKQAPRRLDGQPYGESFERVCQDKEAWTSWLSNNAQLFDAALRYRNGKPVSPATLLADLTDPGGSVELRRLTALELEIRYRCRVAFEVDMPVATQVRALQQIDAWIRELPERLEPGLWHVRNTSE